MVAPTWDQVRRPFYRMYVWSNDDTTDNNMVTRRSINGLTYQAPITRIVNIKRVQTLMQPEQHEITFAITDPRTGVFTPQSGQSIGVSGFNKGSYYEVYIGKDLPAGSSVGNTMTFSYEADSAYRRPYISGYVQDVQRTASKGGQFTITGASKMIWLANTRNLNNLEMDFKTDNSGKPGFNSSYLNVMYALNGLDGAGGEGGPHIAQGPGMKGMLTGTRWRAVWLDHDKKFKPGFKKIPGYGDSWYTAWETPLSNLQIIAQHYNCYFREADTRGRTSTLEFGPLNDTSGITLWGGKELDTVLKDGTPGAPLTGGGFVNTTTGNAFDAANYTHPLSVIQAAQFEDRMDHIINLCWPLGHGTGDEMVTIRPFFHPIEDKHKKINAHSEIVGPLHYSWIDSVNDNIDPPGSGISRPGSHMSPPNNVVTNIPANQQGLHDYYWKWEPEPGAKVLYLMKTFTIGAKRYSGMVAGWDTDPNSGPIVFYQLVCSQDQKGTWAYGVLELNSAMKYGIHEYTLTHEKKITDERLLLSAAIGNVDNAGETTPTWTFPAKHPTDPVSGLPSPSSGTGNAKTPSFAKVGQTLDVRFTGYVYESIEQSPDGQWYGEGKSYEYLHFPRGPRQEYSYYATAPVTINNEDGTSTTYDAGHLVTLTNGDIGQVVNGLMIDKHMFDKICRIQQIEEEWNGHTYDVTYTMGSGKSKKVHWADVIAQRFESQQTTPPRPYPARHLKHQRFDHIPFILEFGAWIDAKDDILYLPSSGSSNGSDPSIPGGIAVSDIEHDHFFDDSHKVQFSVLSESPTAVVDFWFHKPLTHHLADINVDANDAYGLFRVAFSDVKNGRVVKSNSSGKKPGFYVCKTNESGNVSTHIKVGLTHGRHNTKYSYFEPNTIYHVTLQWHNGIHKAWVTNKSKRGDHHELVATWEDMGGKDREPLLVDIDYTKSPPKDIIDPKSGKRKSQFGAIGWRCFGGDGKARAKIFDVHVHPLKNSLGIHSVGEVKPNGSQTTMVNTHLPPGAGTGIVQGSGAGDGSKNPNDFATTQTQVHLNGETFSLKRLTTGTYAARMQLTSMLNNNPDNRAVLFNSYISNDTSFRFKGLPEAAMPHTMAHGGEVTLVSTEFDANSDQLASETFTLPKGTPDVDYVKAPGFMSSDPWYVGFYLPADYELENEYPPGSVIVWHHTPHGGKVYEKYFKGGHVFTDLASGKPLHEHGWGKVMETVGGKDLIIFPDGHIGWNNEHTTVKHDAGGGLKSIAPQAVTGEHFATALDGHGMQLFDALEHDSTTQKVYMYDINGNFLDAGLPSNATIDPTNSNMFYQEGNNQIGSVTVEDGGSGYDPAGFIVFDAPEQPSGGRQATGFPVVDPLNGAILSVIITDPGLGYDSAPTYTLGPTGSGADLTVNLQGTPVGSPYKPTDSQSMQASWVYSEGNDEATGDSDNILQLTTGGTGVANGTDTPTPLKPANTATTVMWQDTQLLLDTDAQGHRRRRQFHIKHDLSFHFPIYIEPARFDGLKTLGAECTLATNVAAGSDRIKVIEPVGDLSFATSAPFDTWSITPSVIEVANTTTDQEFITIIGVDTSTNSLLVGNSGGGVSVTQVDHLKKDRILQNTYLGQTVHSGGKMTTTQHMDDLLPGVDAISFGFLVEYQENVTSNVNSPGHQSVSFEHPITDWSLNDDSPVALMINYKYPFPKTDQEILAPGSYTLNKDGDGHVTGLSATFRKAHPGPFTVTYARWNRGWFGNPGWVAPFKKDVGRANITYGRDGKTPLYQVQVGSTRTMKHLGTLGGPNDIRAGEWIDLHTKASHIGLFDPKHTHRRSFIIGCEIAIHSSESNTPFTVLFDAHSVGSSAKTPPPRQIKNGSVKFHHKHPKGFGDSTFTADMYLWAQRDGDPDPNSKNYEKSTRNDGNYYVHWEHDTGGGKTPSTIITHQSPKTNTRHQVWAGARQDLTSGGVSEDHPNWGIPAWPLVRDEKTGHINTAILKDGTHFVGTDINHIAWHHVFFNTNKSGFYVHDPGVKGERTWVPGYNKVGSRATNASSSGGLVTYTIPQSEMKQWQNYWDMATISGTNKNNSGFVITYNGALVLVTQGSSGTAIDPTPMQLAQRPSNGTLVLKQAQIGTDVGPNVPTATVGNDISGQTMGMAIVSHWFDWHKKTSGGAVLEGPHEDFFHIGQIQNKPDPVNGEIPIKSVGGSTKQGSSQQRKGTTKPSHLSWHHISVHHHHNLAFGLDSTNKTAINPVNPDGKKTCTFHAHRVHHNNTHSQIETDKGKFIGALPWINGKQQNVYINGVNPHDYIVFDTGDVTGYDPGFYVYRTKGTHAAWSTGASKPSPAKFAGQILSPQPTPLSQGKCYTKVKIKDPSKSDNSFITAWRFDPHKDDSLGFVLIGRVSEHPDPRQRQYYLEGTKPHSQKSTGATTGKKTVGKGAMHNSVPQKKKRVKRKTTQQQGSKKKSAVVH